jgi:hypothetical protein
MSRRRVSEDQLSFAWRTPRPSYMREIEPLAHEGAWPTPDVWPPAVTEDPLLTPEQIANRKLFIEDQERKGPQPSAASSQLPANTERKTG